MTGWLKILARKDIQKTVRWERGPKGTQAKRAEGKVRGGPGQARLAAATHLHGACRLSGTW